MIKDLNTKIDDNIVYLEQLSKENDIVTSILVELETNRLIHERNYLEITELLVNIQKKIDKLDKKLQKITEKPLKQGFLSKFIK
jgi:hypothetical protein